MKKTSFIPQYQKKWEQKSIKLEEQYKANLKSIFDNAMELDKRILLISLIVIGIVTNYMTRSFTFHNNNIDIAILVISLLINILGLINIYYAIKIIKLNIVLLSKRLSKYMNDKKIKL